MTKEETTRLIEAKSLRTVDEFKNSVTFKKEVIEASSYYYEYGFDDCKAKVRELFPGLDLRKVVLQEEEDEEEEEEITEEGEIREDHAEEETVMRE